MKTNGSKFTANILVLLLLSATASGCWFWQDRRALDTPGVQSLTGTHDIALTEPRWSPDGTRVLALRPSGAPEGPGGAIYTVELATGHIEQVIPKQGLRHTIYGATWTYTGHAIAYSGSEEEGDGVYLFDLETEQSRYLVGWANNAALSPTKDQIALWGPVNRSAKDRDWKLSVVDLSDLNETIIFAVQTYYVDLGGLSWSSDGQRIAFAIPNVGSSNSRQWYDINAINVDGSDLQQLTHNTAADAIAPTWSPDGQHIAYTQGEATRVREGYLWVMNADGSCPVQLLDAAGVNTPTWSPDGESILLEYNGSLYLLDLGNEAIAKRMQGLNCR